MKHARILVVLWCSAIAAPSAYANKADYCAAYARDFADARATAKPLWQHKYDIALAACIDPPKIVSEPKVPTAKVKPKPVQEVFIPPEPEPDPLPAPVVAKPTKKLRLILAPGSVEWNVYCGKKYASFNAKTGNYLSRTGTERKCLVTG